MSEPQHAAAAPRIRSAAIPADPVERMLLRVRLACQLRVLWLRTLWRRESDLEARRTVTHAQVDGALEEWDNPAAEADFQQGFPAARAAAEQLRRVEAAMAADETSRLAVLERLFVLTTPERDLLQLCLAAQLDPTLGRVFAYLQDVAGRAYVTEELMRLFGPGRGPVLNAESPLRRWHLISEEPAGVGEPPALVVDPLVATWVTGGEHLDEALVGAARPQALASPLPRWPVEDVVRRIEHRLAAGGRVRVNVQGTPGSGRRTFAAGVAAQLGLRLLTVDADTVDDDRWPAFFVRAQRQAFLDRCALAWSGERIKQRPWPRAVTPFSVQFLIVEAGDTPLPAIGVTDEAVMLPPPSAAEREALWRRLVPETLTWPSGTVTALAARHRVTVGDIAAVAARHPPGPDDATAQVRSAIRHRLGDLAASVDCPFGWDDLVLPGPLRQALGDLVYEAEARAAVWEAGAARRLFPQGRGLLALLSGPPGTGKTMAAQVIAASLGLDLFRVALSEVISKFIGDTSKNLQRIFARAEEMDAVVLFDEADALFSRRTEVKDAHDRFANADTNHLLQAVESYSGLALLATNRKANIDPAFLRRIRYVLEFPKPGGDERRTLWQRLVAELAGDAAAAGMAGKLDRLADTVEATGAQIKYAVLTALFAARHDGRPMAIEHLLRGLERELVKEGRALTERDRDRLSAP